MYMLQIFFENIRDLFSSQMYFKFLCFLNFYMGFKLEMFFKILVRELSDQIRTLAQLWIDIFSMYIKKTRQT